MGSSLCSEFNSWIVFFFFSPHEFLPDYVFLHSLLFCSFECQVKLFLSLAMVFEPLWTVLQWFSFLLCGFCFYFLFCVGFLFLFLWIYFHSQWISVNVLFKAECQNPGLANCCTKKDYCFLTQWSNTSE